MELELLTVDEAAASLKINKITLLRAIKAGELEAFSLGRSYQIKKEALTAWVQSRKVTVRISRDAD